MHGALRRSAVSITTLSAWVLFALLYVAVAVSHLTLLRLPYFWDEGGYYIPAALDFYRQGRLVPHFTNAHPPLPNVVLGTLWHLTGFHILATRLIVCAFAAAGLLAVLRLAGRLLGPSAALAVTLLTAVYPIWFAQSTLAHADIFAAAFTLWAFALYLPERQGVGRREQGVEYLSVRDGGVISTGGRAPCGRSGETSALRVATTLDTDKESAQGHATPTFIPRSLLPTPYSLLSVSLLFTLAALSKETSILQPAALAALELVLLIREPQRRREHLRWLAALSFPLLPLVLWYAYHHHVTGFTFGNPEYLRYNATANLTVAHVLTALRYRFLHLAWQRQIWLPITLALACLLLPRRSPSARLPALGPILWLLLANWLAFSVLGGALLTRYLLPIYPLILLLCVAIWRERTTLWPAFTALTAAVFISAWWLNPPTYFAPEDNLTYRDMVVAHELAIDYVAAHYPHAVVLTAWPVSADLFDPDLGYVTMPIRSYPIEDFTMASLRPLVAETQRSGTAPYDTAIVFTTHFLEPGYRRYLAAHPDTRRGREFAQNHDLSPNELARLLGGEIVFETDQRGEWAAVLRFNRSYEALAPKPPAANLRGGDLIQTVN